MNTSKQVVTLTAASLAERWGTSVGQLANLRSEGRGPCFLKLGKSIRYRLSDVEAFEAASLVGTFEQGAA